LGDITVILIKLFETAYINLKENMIFLSFYFFICLKYIVTNCVINLILTYQFFYYISSLDLNLKIVKLLNRNCFKIIVWEAF
jgi:hypothetical protein